MRVRIVFKSKNRGGYVPFHHQHLLYQLVNDLLQNAEKQIKEYQFYNFSGLKGQTKVSRNGLHFYSSKVTLVISSRSTDFVDFVIREMFHRKEIEIGNLTLIPEFVEKESPPSFGSSVKYLCISPLVLVNPEYNNYYAKKFIPPDTDMFSDLLYESTMTRMEKTGLYTEKEIASFFRFQIIPDRIYLKKIREDDKKFARIYSIYEGKAKYELRGYTFPFVLYATDEVQRFIFDCGLGAYTYRGFGMVDLANTDPVKRTIMYESISGEGYSLE